MALIKPINGLTPHWGKDCYFSENATIVGEVTMGDECSIWFNAVVRGDVAPITIGHRTNVQDGACIHVTNTTGPTVIGNDVTIGHNATVHACTINDGALIGMGATLLDGCEVGPRSRRGSRRPGSSGHKDRRPRTVGRRTGQVHQDGARRTGGKLRPTLRGILKVVPPGDATALTGLRRTPTSTAHHFRPSTVLAALLSGSISRTISQ
mgnify:CR=1 FL=1